MKTCRLIEDFGIKVRPKTIDRTLTPAQARVLKAFRELVEANGITPCIREIGEVAGLRSSSTVHGHLEALRQKGYLDGVAGRARSMRLVSSLDPREVREVLTQWLEAAPGAPEELREWTRNILGGAA